MSNQVSKQEHLRARVCGIRKDHRRLDTCLRPNAGAEAAPFLLRVVQVASCNLDSQAQEHRRPNETETLFFCDRVAHCRPGVGPPDQPRPTRRLYRPMSPSSIKWEIANAANERVGFEISGLMASTFFRHHPNRSSGKTRRRCTTWTGSLSRLRPIIPPIPVRSSPSAASHERMSWLATSRRAVSS